MTSVDSRIMNVCESIKDCTVLSRVRLVSGRTLAAVVGLVMYDDDDG